MTPKSRRGLRVVAAATLGAVLGLLLFLFTYQPPTPAPKPKGRAPAGLQQETTLGKEIPSRRAPAATPKLVASSPSGGSIAGVHVRVLGDGGLPLAGAQVYFARRGHAMTSRSAAHPTETDNTGICTLSPPFPDGDLLCRARGFIPVVSKRESLKALASDSGTYEIQLVRGLRIAGVVRDIWGKPLGGVQVCALGRYGEDLLDEMGDSLPGEAAAADVATAMSDFTGKFEISGILDFPVYLRIRKVGYVDYAEGGVRMLRSESSTMEITLQPQYRAGVLILDDASGQPIDAMQVSVTAAEGLFRSSSGTDYRAPGDPQDGWNPGTTLGYWCTFRVGDSHTAFSATERARVRVDALGYRPFEGVVDLHGPDDQRPLEPLVVRLNSAEGSKGSGRLAVAVKCSTTSVPMSALVRIIDQGAPKTREEEGMIVSVELDASGNGSVGLPVGKYRLRLESMTGSLAWRTRNEWQECEVRDGEVATATFEMKEAVLRVTAVDPKGEKVTAFTVTISPHKEAQPNSPPPPGLLRGSAPVAIVRTERIGKDDILRKLCKVENSDSGTAEIVVNPGKFIVSASKPGFGSAWQIVTVDPGQRTDVSIRLKEE